jgi:hypothetical protein
MTKHRPLDRATFQTRPAASFVVNCAALVGTNRTNRAGPFNGVHRMWRRQLNVASSSRDETFAALLLEYTMEGGIASSIA